ncbi:hypothetical protein FQA39_LY01171 [Lamprigera yunnana]|nr:hypothetical protein FQA39_LY01171 [Lamprigera yunnana]
MIVNQPSTFASSNTAELNEDPGSSAIPTILHFQNLFRLLTLDHCLKRKQEQNKRKRVQKSEIITSSPFINILEEKLGKEKGNQKTSFQRVKDSSTSSSSNTMPAKKIKIADKEEVFCPACEEKYTEPPKEDWIMCYVCKDWWHEACTSYEGMRNFVCDYC